MAIKSSADVVSAGDNAKGFKSRPAERHFACLCFLLFLPPEHEKSTEKALKRLPKFQSRLTDRRILLGCRYLIPAGTLLTRLYISGKSQKFGHAYAVPPCICMGAAAWALFVGHTIGYAYNALLFQQSIVLEPPSVLYGFTLLPKFENPKLGNQSWQPKV